ncbi:DegT/DnrJ/EryC1/StrS family aminotransferase [Anaerolinea thermophila]|uniref:Aminotransferase n=1 Tax=Anaerolinea thermophila (strain DSM 14523 / JCM 11388 / NBRC 100420 / UNI-1) TaxID=926569 RepID=E8N5L7_ANATU|nr:DegT/DnrJ/EryC1/StrS family aminotransferase [Anaerolinea thermophila]BAJ63731.1 putative aminotransferase [Anaerolinea thermophila UNI-1]
MEWRVPLADLDYGPEEADAVLNVLKRKWLTMGEITQDFERAFAEMHGAKYAFGVANATVALHLACLALEIQPGDEVIVPSLSFVATSNAVLYTGANVRFADILGLENLTVDPEEIRQKITSRTKAIIVMHYGGYPCQMEEITRIAREYNLVIIEDAAHAPGASLNGKPLGIWGDIGCFSFFSNKNLSTGEGGMVITNREDLAEKIRLLRSHGMTTLTYDRHRGHAFSYDVLSLGYNYRIDEIHSALGIAQLQKLSRNNALRRQWTDLYRQELADLPLVLPFTSTPGESACHLFPVLLPAKASRERFMQFMREQGVQTSIHYPPIHSFSYYREKYGHLSLPRTEMVGLREVTLPLYPTMGEEKVKTVVQAVRKALQNAEI